MLSSVFLGVLLSGSSVIDLDGSFFVQLAIFFCAFFILKGLVFGPVMRLFDQRDEAVAGARTRAQQMEEDAEQKRTHFEGELRRVSQAAQQDREKLRNEAQKAAREIQEQARLRNQGVLAEARTRLEAEADKARSESRAQIPQLARQIAEKLLDRSVS